MATTEEKIKNMNTLGRIADPETNPCIKEYHLTNKCLLDNNFVKEKCEIYFENYRNCKQFWFTVQLQRKSKGITPHMPDKEEREKIVEERRKKLNIHDN